VTDTNIGSSVSSDLAAAAANALTAYRVSPAFLDGSAADGETSWRMSDWEVNFGFYKTIPELQTAIDSKAVWTLGAGFTADEVTTLLLGSIKGLGKDSFNSLLSNMVRVYTVGGDSFAEIVRDKDGVLVNLKPLDPSTVSVVVDKKGLVKRYEVVGVGEPEKFKPDEIFHLSRKRIGNEIHGMSVIPSVKWIIQARNEAMADWKRVLHRNVEPLWIFHLDTDDDAQISSFKSKMDSARVNGENMYVPKGTVVPEIVTTAANATLNPLTWINQLNDYFFQAVNVPQIIIGNAKEFTDASGKIVYLSYEQSVKSEQLYIEEQVLGQLNLEIQLTFPASLQNDLITGEAKNPVGAAANPNDVMVEMEGPR
jgi:hypothetical protein